MTNTLAMLNVKDDRQYNVKISEDTGDDDKPIAVLLFTPDMNVLIEHYHIELSLDEAKQTYDWLHAFLKKHDQIESVGL